MNRGNLASLFVSLLLILGICLALTPTTAQAADIPSDTSFGSWDPDTRTYTLNTDVAEGILITDNDFTLDGDGYWVTGDKTGRGVDLQDGTYVTIKNLTVQNFEYGIYLDHSNSNTLQGNTVSTNITGIYLDCSNNNTLEGNTVSRNITGIYLDCSNNNTLEGNTAWGNGDGILLGSSSGSTLEKNTVSHNHRSGISLWDSSNNNTLEDNTISNNSKSGISLGSSDNNTLEGNTAEDNSEYGIDVWSSSSNTIYNNYFNNNTNVRCGGTIYANTWNTTKTPGTNIVGGPYLGGNFWAQPNDDGFSQTHPDKDGDGICDDKYTLASDNVDNLPLAPYSLSLFSPLIIYPNPCYLNQAGFVTFSNLPLESEVRIYIYDLGGSLVRSLGESDTVIEGGSKACTWNLKNDRGEMVARGIYLYHILSASEKRTGKIAIIK